MTEYGVKSFSFANIDHTAGKIIASYFEIGNLAKVDKETAKLGVERVAR